MIIIDTQCKMTNKAPLTQFMKYLSILPPPYLHLSPLLPLSSSLPTQDNIYLPDFKWNSKVGEFEFLSLAKNSSSESEHTQPLFYLKLHLFLQESWRDQMWIWTADFSLESVSYISSELVGPNSQALDTSEHPCP